MSGSNAPRDTNNNKSKVLKNIEAPIRSVKISKEGISIDRIVTKTK
ncbi:MAG: hypothetical protein R6W73_05150 [Candidatus Saliniplasma sp.]